MPRPSLPDKALALLEMTSTTRGAVLLLTGAGISAESGIPTFRGEEGYWRAGSRNYHPQELATWSAFSHMPEEVWAWYLYRRGVCRAATPNAAHEACAALEEALGDRFALVTQNVDGLHLRAGNSQARTYQIHGNIDFMRCAARCNTAVRAIPDAIDLAWDRGRALGEAERRQLRCPDCGGLARPHVLWFDESYDEVHFRADSALSQAGRAALLIVVGTTGATTLPMHIALAAQARGTPIIVVNPEANPFSAMAERDGGVFLQGTAGRFLPDLLAAVT